MSFAFPTAEALGLRFRPALDEDLRFLAHLYASTRWEEVAQTGWPAEAQARFLANQFDLQLSHYRKFYPDAEQLVVERDGAPIGRVYLSETDSTVNLMDIAFLPESRRGGLGTAILSDLIRLGRESGRKVVLYVEKNNPARGLYDRLGFAALRDEGVYDYMEWVPGPS